jgi:Esterase-like activity of phytase
LTQRPGDTKGCFWAISDRGPNLKIKTAIKRYGMEHLGALTKVDGAKIMPRPDIGPMFCQLKVSGSKVALVRKIPLITASRRVISGLPPSTACDVEPAFDLKGKALGIDPSGADTEGITALADGTFWIADEYGPSLVHVGPEGEVLQRWVPKGVETALKLRTNPSRGVPPAIA